LVAPATVPRGRRHPRQNCPRPTHRILFDDTKAGDPRATPTDAVCRHGRCRSYLRITAKPDQRRRRGDRVAPLSSPGGVALGIAPGCGASRRRCPPGTTHLRTGARRPRPVQLCAKFVRARAPTAPPSARPRRPPSHATQSRSRGALLPDRRPTPAATANSDGLGPRSSRHDLLHQQRRATTKPTVFVFPPIDVVTKSPTRTTPVASTDLHHPRVPSTAPWAP